MIEPFVGELFHHPAALDYSGNTCSHNCCYCFANLNEPIRNAEFKQTLNFLKTRNKLTSLPKILLDEGFPICVSNKSDPLSDSNAAQTFGLIPILNTLPNGIYWQTKGGKRWREFVDAIKGKKNQVVYLTITSINDDLAKSIEPNAPRPSERIEFAKALISEGIPVEIGINPITEEWFPEKDVLKFVDDMNAAGVGAYMINALYLRDRWVDRFTQKRKDAFGDFDIESAVLIPRTYSEHQIYCVKIVDLLRERGNENVLCWGLPETQHAHEWRREKLGLSMPVMYDFLNLVNSLPDDAEITFEHFKQSLIAGDEKLRQFFEKPIPMGYTPYVFKLSLRSYLDTPKSQDCKTFSEFLRLVWNDKRIKYSPQGFRDYLEVSGVDEDKNLVLRKKKGE